MADIVIRCENCGAERKVSEYAAKEGIRCLACDTELQVPTVQKASSLRVRNPDSLGAGLLVEPKKTRTHTREQDEIGTGALKDVYRERKAVKTTRKVWGWLACILLTGLMVWLQMGVSRDPDMLGLYNVVRGIAGGLIYLLVIVVAFEDHVWQGLLALLVPPYCIYYALIRLDAYVLRSLFLAIVVAIVAEVKFIPEHALVSHAQDGVTSFIQTIEGMIEHAGEAPTFD